MIKSNRVPGKTQRKIGAREIQNNNCNMEVQWLGKNWRQPASLFYRILYWYTWKHTQLPCYVLTISHHSVVFGSLVAQTRTAYTRSKHKKKDLGYSSDTKIWKKRHGKSRRTKKPSEPISPQRVRDSDISKRPRSLPGRFLYKCHEGDISESHASNKTSAQADRIKVARST